MLFRSGESHLAFLAELTRAVVESYYVAVSAVAQQTEPAGRRALERRIRERSERATLLGETLLPEANNPITFGNALDLLIRRGVLAAASVAQRAEGERRPSGGRDPLFGRGPEWPELERLRERLATALRPR